MEQLYILLLCISLILLIRLAFLRRTKSKNQPPGPNGLPIIGSLLQLGENPHQSLFHLSKIYGPLMTLRLGSITTIVATSADIAKDILHNHDQSFANRPVPDAATAQPNYESTLAGAPGNHVWRYRRRICSTQLFNSQSLDSLQHLRNKKVQHLIAHIRKCSSVPGGPPVDIGQLAFATSLNLISNTIFSIDLVDQEFKSAQEFKDLVWRIMEDSGKANLSDFFPVIRRFDVQGIKRHILSSYTRMHEIFDEIIGDRIKSRSHSSSDNKINNNSAADFLDVLLDQCQKEDSSNFTLQNIKPLLLDLFIAGSDTSAITVEWALAELLRKPELLLKAQKEVAEVIGTENSIKESDINRLPYIQAIIKETLRLHPAAPLLLPYKASNDVQISGFTIPKDSQVLVNAWAIARDPTYWDDPMSFSPERFLDSSSSTTKDFKGHDFEYIPFGAGRRICPRLPLAIRMVSLEVASLLHSFNWKLPEGTTPESLDMKEQFGITLKKAVPLLVIPTPTIIL